LGWGDELEEVTEVVLGEARKSDVKENVYVDVLFVDSTFSTQIPGQENTGRGFASVSRIIFGGEELRLGGLLGGPIGLREGE
jgi:hypothetical protein